MAKEEMMKGLSRLTLMAIAFFLLISTSGCFHHHKHVRHKSPAAESTRAPKIRYLPQWLAPAQKVSTPKKVYTYQYYPTVNIYYDTTRKLYFFTDGEDWQEAPRLPSNVQIDQDEGVTVKLKTDKPFLSEVSRDLGDPTTW